MLLTANIFQPLIDVFEAVLKFFHSSGGISWGWSIVLLTVCIRLVMVPLTMKQFHSMQALQRLQPEMKALQNKYKDDKQRQQQEMMKFYKENNVNPLGSCLPMALQLPVFLSLYYMLRQDLRANICKGVQTAFQHRYALKHHVSFAQAAGQTTACGPGHHANFLFISDLTNNAHGTTLVVLIVLYVGTQLASSLLMAAPTMDKTQRRIMMLMPLFFVFFVLKFPSGVIVYWITTNTWTMLQQYVLRRRIGGAGKAPVAVAGAAAAPTRGPILPRSSSAPEPSNGDARGTGRARAREEPARDAGGSSGGGLGALLRGRKAEPDSAPVAAGGRARTAAPPPPPRKKKKRSGRRR